MATSPSEPTAGTIEEPYDDQPVRTLPPDEPLTPMWMPVVGAALLLVGALGWALLGADEESDRAGASASSATPAASPAAPPAGTARRPAARPARRPGARPTAAPTLQRPAPKDMDRISDALKRARGGQGK